MPFVENSQPHFMATVKRGSHDPATTDSEGNEISPWSLALLRIYGPDGHEEREFAVDASKDIHPLESHSPLENYASSGILFPLHQTIEVKLTGTTRLARTYMRFNLSTGAQSTLDDVVKRAQGANQCLYRDNHMQQLCNGDHSRLAGSGQRGEPP
jgi:hypothetical protein